MTLEELFVAIYNAIATRPKGWRAGQAAFNCLYDLYPNIANAIRSTPADPFYRDEKLPLFFDTVAGLCK